MKTPTLADFGISSAALAFIGKEDDTGPLPTVLIPKDTSDDDDNQDFEDITVDVDVPGETVDENKAPSSGLQPLSQADFESISCIHRSDNSLPATAAFPRSC